MSVIVLEPPPPHPGPVTVPPFCPPGGELKPDPVDPEPELEPVHEPEPHPDEPDPVDPDHDDPDPEAAEATTEVLQVFDPPVP